MNAPGTSDLRAQVASLNLAGGAYHRYAFDDGVVIEGDYDLSKYLRHYDLPNDLAGKSVLDVGTSSGFLAVECARRGGEVTAIDIWETPRALQLACSALGVQVRYVQKNVFDLDAAFGQFDLVICGSMLLHVASPVEALRKIRQACKGRTIVSTTCTIDSETNGRPICEFLGVHAKDGDYWHYWSMSGAALAGMLLAAGFSEIERTAHFSLETEPGRVQYVSPHVVVTARV
jgi:SAM-dependent methyltransferase